VFCLIVILLPPGKNQFAVEIIIMQSIPLQFIALNPYSHVSLVLPSDLSSLKVFPTNNAFYAYIISAIRATYPAYLTP
jgi:hypothetical protein